MPGTHRRTLRTFSFYLGTHFSYAPTSSLSSLQSFQNIGDILGSGCHYEADQVFTAASASHPYPDQFDYLWTRRSFPDLVSHRRSRTHRRRCFRRLRSRDFRCVAI
jgi:hypothetical protein